VKARTTSLVLAFLVQLRLPFPNSPYPSYCDQTPATISKQGFTNKTPVQLPPRLIAPTKPAFRTSHREKSHGDTPKQDYSNFRVWHSDSLLPLLYDDLHTLTFAGRQTRPCFRKEGRTRLMRCDVLGRFSTLHFRIIRGINCEPPQDDFCAASPHILRRTASFSGCKEAAA
jgi:hypothetical protein